MSFIGLSHFPVLHRQFSSPTSTVLESSPSQDLTQDSKDVLIERLNDLVLRLSKDSSIEDSTLAAIHTGVDRIEGLMKGREKETQKKSPQVGSESKHSRGNSEDILWGSPLTPSRNIRMRFPDSPTSPPNSVHRRPRMTADRAIEIAKSAEELSNKLLATVIELQTRKEESDHIHDLLITRAEKAAERILVLEYRIKEMEEDFDANQSELKFLRIQLQAIEAQCAQYIPHDEDEELSRSIMNWKIDWGDIDRRSKARRKKCHPPKAILDDSLKILDGP